MDTGTQLAIDCRFFPSSMVFYIIGFLWYKTFHLLSNALGLLFRAINQFTELFLSLASCILDVCP